ncbi:hypothetical protein AB0L59_39740 [Streptomyces sp. NPDC052109]|uniref:hypothetical protein n=1 Tax=Streptomyces sp. NPDC052109 TaxID=3155527 RepID=UPI003425DC9B
MTTSGPASFPVAEAALRPAFGGPVPAGCGAFGEPGERRRRLVRVLAGLDTETGQWVNLWTTVRAWGLPTLRNPLRAYAGLPEEQGLPARLTDP